MIALDTPARSAGPPPSRTDYELLHAVADRASIPAAAQTTGMTGAAAARRISRLERRYGVPLVEGAADHARLTPAARALLSAGRQLLLTLDRILGGIDTGTAGPGPHAPGVLPTLRMAAFGSDWTRLADDLLRHVPGLLLDVVPAEPAAAHDAFERHRVDAAYLWRPPGADRGHERPALVETIAREPLWVALPTGHRLADRTEVRLVDLAKDPWVVGAEPEARELLAAACRGVIEPRVGYAAASPEQLRGLLGHERGVALVSPLIRQPLDQWGFVIRPLTEAPYRRLLLVSDPAVVRPGLAAALSASLRRCYVERTNQRNPAYLYAPGFPLNPVESLVGEPVDAAADGELFSGLTLLPDPSREARTAALEPEDLRLLRVVGECGSINRAAPLLATTQPALTRRIGRLEKRLDLRLLHRGHRGTVLTPAARGLLEGASEAEWGVRSVLIGFQNGHRPGPRAARPAPAP